MATFDRSKFKKSKSLADQQKELVDSGKIKTRGSNGLPEFLEFKEDGEYLLKFYPSHLDEMGEPLSYFMMMRRYTFLKFMKDQYKDGDLVVDSEGNAVQDVSTGIVLDSTVNGTAKKDLINEYKAFVREQGMEMFDNDKEGYKDYMKNIWGYGHGKNFYGGLKASEEFIAYASLIDPITMKEIDFHRVVLKPSMRKEMLKMCATEDGGEGITTDPFTDPDDGFLVKITRDSVAAKKANDPSLYYDVAFHTKQYVPVKWALPEDFPERMDEIPSLSEMFEDKYTAKDFQKALDGLQRFDEEHEYNVFTSDAWLDICEEIAAQYPEEEEESESAEPTIEPAKKAAAPKRTPAPKKAVAPTPEPEEESPEELDENSSEEEVPFEEEKAAPVASSTGTMSPAEKLAEMKAKAAGRAK